MARKRYIQIILFPIITPHNALISIPRAFKLRFAHALRHQRAPFHNYGRLYSLHTTVDRITVTLNVRNATPWSPPSSFWSSSNHVSDRRAEVGSSLAACREIYENCTPMQALAGHYRNQPASFELGTI